MTGDEERLARVAISAIAEPGDLRLTRLVEELGAVCVHDRLRDDRDLLGLRSELSVRLAATEPERTLEGAYRRGIRFAVPGDAEWPDSLSALADVEPLNRLGGAPVGLWLRGPLPLAEAGARSVSIVGSRSATSYGDQVARDFGARAAGAGITVVSGAAFGVDIAAHRGALAARGPTVAVLACGVDRHYPAAHRDLLELLAADGLIVSEVPPGWAPSRVRFLSRNRLIAALTAGTVVVEAAVRSGALNTASWAVRLNRPLMGVPGAVTSAPSEGVHELVRSGAATLVTRFEHVLEMISPSGSFTLEPPRSVPTHRDRLHPTAQRVLEAVPLYTPSGIRSIAGIAGLSEATVAECLGRLLRLGWVAETDGRWCRIRDGR